MQTAVVDYIFEQLEENSLFFRGTDNELNISISASDYLDLKRLAKEMEKQQIIDAYYGYELYLDREFRFQQGGQAKILTFDQWYETYGSKGSDEHIVDTNEMISDEEKTNSQRFDEFMDLVTSSQTEISDEEIIKQGFLHSFLNELPDENALSWIEGFKSCIKQLQISNNEIDKAAEQYFNEHIDDMGYDGFKEGAKWYREQLKKKQ